MREAAEARNLTLKEIASRMHKAPSLISMWWSGKRTPQPDDLATYAAFVGVPVEHFMQYERQLPENQHIRSKIDDLIYELQHYEDRVAEGKPEYKPEPQVKQVKASNGNLVCIPADLDPDQETIDIIDKLLRKSRNEKIA